MIVDGSQLAADTRAQVIVVGAGPSGIVLALELARAGLEVLLLESGGHEPGSGAGVLSAGTQLPGSYLSTTSPSGLGGASAVWLGVCRPVDEAVLRPRPWMADGDWPLTADEVHAELADACAWCEVPALEGPLTGGPGLELDAGPGLAFRTLSLPRSAPTHFGSRYASRMEAETRLRVALGVTALKLDLGEDGRAVRGLEVHTPSGARTLVADRYVLAAGLGNAQLLLASELDNDNVGRWFTEQPRLLSGHAVLVDDQLDRYDPSRPGPLHTLQLTPETQQEQQIVDAEVSLLPSEDDHAGDNRTLGRLLSLGGDPVTPSARQVQLRLEQVPHRDNRIELTDEVDPTGRRVPKLTWALREDDTRNADTVAGLLARALGAQGLGRLHLADAEVTVPGHGTGTTRMSRTPETGVVDGHGRVHGVTNLYVTGPSTFPSAGAAPPLLTAVALTLRLADRLVNP